MNHFDCTPYTKKFTSKVICKLQKFKHLYSLQTFLNFSWKKSENKVLFRFQYITHRQVRLVNLILHVASKVNIKKTSMMWPSQNFLLYSGTTMLIVKKEIFKLEWQPLPLFATHVIPDINHNNLISKKSRRFKYQQSVIINVRKKSIYCLPDDSLRRF